MGLNKEWDNAWNKSWDKSGDKYWDTKWDKVWAKIELNSAYSVPTITSPTILYNNEIAEGVTETGKSTLDNIIEHCKECGSPIIEKWSGIECSKCDFWECF